MDIQTELALNQVGACLSTIGLMLTSMMSGEEIPKSDLSTLADDIGQLNKQMTEIRLARARAIDPLEE